MTPTAQVTMQAIEYARSVLGDPGHPASSDLAALIARYDRLLAEDEPGIFSWHQALHDVAQEARRAAEKLVILARDARWTALRDQIARDAATEQELGDDYGEAGTHSSWDGANKHWGRAEALREVLATMDAMEAGQ